MRNTLLRPTIEKQPENNIRLVTNYNPRKPSLLQILKNFEALMTRKPAIKPENIQITYSRSPNLKDMLVKIVYSQPQPKLSQPCWQPRCLICPNMNTSQVICNKCNHSYPIRGNFQCKSSNVIYVMTCNVCNIQYVGET